jgi:sec-independent protein translocase protein TatB
MLDIGWTELLVIAVVLIVVVGPKDLPPMLRAFGKMTSNFRKMAGDFRAQFDEALRESDMDDVRKTISDAQRLNPTNALRDAINPLRQMGQDIKADLQKATQMPGPLASNATQLSETDVEAQQAIEGAEPVSVAPEVPASVEPTAKPAAPVAAAPVTAVTTGTTLPAAATAAPAGSPEMAASVPAKARKTAATKTVSTKAGAKTSSVKAPTAKKPAAKGDATAVKPDSVVAEVSAAPPKPKRTTAGSKTSGPAVTTAEAPATKAPARKRAVKKTDTAKDEA